MLNLANTVTAIRLSFFFIFLYFVQYLTRDNVLLYLVSLFVIFFMDCVDGFIARRYSMESSFGAFFDIYSDRIIESLLWFLFYFKSLVGVDIIFLILIRIATVDLIRLLLFKSNGDVPFKQLNTKLSEFLISNKVIKFTYGSLKLWTFSVLLFFSSVNNDELTTNEKLLVNVSVYITVVFMIVRGLPVILEYFYSRSSSS